MTAIETLAKAGYEEYRSKLMLLTPSTPCLWENLSPAAQQSFVVSAKKILHAYVTMSDETAVAVTEELFP